jgi:two-component system, OmpR family, phosphate regulon sensor histidine kinase PhoR
MHNAAEYIEHSVTDTDLHTRGNWMLALSIAAGALLLSIFQAVFVAVALIMLIWIAWMFIAQSRLRDEEIGRVDRLRDQQVDAKKQSDLLLDMIDAANIPILSTDDFGYIIYVNKQAQNLVGHANEILGRRFDEIMTQRALHELESMARDNEPGHARLAIPVRGEIREFDVSADLVPISRGAVLTFRDITELSRAMTLKADFVANASHELRTPIASIKGAGETLSGPARDDPQMSQRLVQMILSNAARLEMLASDLMDLSNIESEDHPSEIVRVNLDSLIQRIIEDSSPAASKRRLELVIEHVNNRLGHQDEQAQHVKPDQSSIWIQSDPKLLNLMISNLLQNAIKFAREDTKIRVQVLQAEICLERTANIPEALNGTDGVIISVVDKGVGIPLAHQQRVFERFYQVDDARSGSGASRGTGLGLAIVKHAARRLGGSVHLESIYQTGTTVTIELPRCVVDVPNSDSGANSA